MYNDGYELDMVENRSQMSSIGKSSKQNSFIMRNYYKDSTTPITINHANNIN